MDQIDFKKLIRLVIGLFLTLLMICGVIWNVADDPWHTIRAFLWLFGALFLCLLTTIAGAILK